MESLWTLLHPLWPPLLLLVVANASPILARHWLGERFSTPLDSGHSFFDQRPILGHTKTWRGVVAAVLCTTPCAMVLGYEWWLGISFALLSMLGDLLASFSKRRLGLAPRGQALGLDQIPEALLPLWLLHIPLSLESMQLLIIVGLFLLLELGVSPLLYRWHIRLRPY